jgi:hypothetical protein
LLGKEEGNGVIAKQLGQRNTAGDVVRIGDGGWWLTLVVVVCSRWLMGIDFQKNRSKMTEDR